MIKMKLPDNIKDSGLALPDSTPKTLIEIDGESLPYACQCPCCGALFNIPEGLLYKVEEDALADGTFGPEDSEGDSTDINIDMDDAGSDSGIDSSPSQGSDMTSSASGVGEANDTII